MNIVELTLESSAEMFAIESKAHSHPMSLAGIESCFGPLYHVLGISDATNLLGFIILHQIFEDATLMDICIAPDTQGAGLGQSLLQAGVEQMLATDAETLFLEVRESGLAARHVYLKLGFAETGRRKGYYKTESGVEDAILMELNLNRLKAQS